MQEESSHAEDSHLSQTGYLPLTVDHTQVPSNQMRFRVGIIGTFAALAGSSGGAAHWNGTTTLPDFPDAPWNPGGAWVSELSSLHFAGGSVYSDLVNPADFALTDLYRGTASDGTDPGCDISRLPSIAAIT